LRWGERISCGLLVTEGVFRPEGQDEIGEVVAEEGAEGSMVAAQRGRHVAWFLSGKLVQWYSAPRDESLADCMLAAQRRQDP
jgi:hypothetical protein